MTSAVVTVTAALAVTAGSSAAASPAVPTATTAEQQLVDETGVLTVTVPADWTDVDAVPGYRDDGTPRPRIVAAPDIVAYSDTWTTPGVTYFASPAHIEPATLLANQNFSAECTDGGTAPFSNSQFSGTMQTWTDCGGTSSRLMNVAARPADGSFTAFVQLLLTTPDDAVVDMVHSSVGVVAGEVVSESSVAAGDAVTTGSVPDEFLELEQPASPDAITLRDDTGQLSVAVPGTWVDTDLTPGLNDDGSSRPFIAAAPSIDDLYTSWETAGVILEVYPFADAPFLIDNLGYPGDCTDGGLQTFDNGTYSGYAKTWSDCGGTDTRIVTVAAHPADESRTLYVEIQLPDEDLTGLQTVLSTFSLTTSSSP